MPLTNKKGKKRKYKKVKVKADHMWTNEDMAEAIHEYQSVPGKSKREAARNHGIEESTLRNRLKKIAQNVPLKKRGRK